jgi:hypothetical protein
MMSLILAFLAAGAVLFYWRACRAGALKHQLKVAAQLESYFNDHKVSEEDKDGAYWTYRFGRMWAFMPMMALIAPIWLGFSMLVRGPGYTPKKASAQHTEIIDSIVKMYVAKNPLTAIVCMPVCLLLIGALSTIGLVFNRLKSIPSPGSIYSAVAISFTHSSREGKLHH